MTTITHTTKTYYGEADIMHAFEITKDGTVIAELYADLHTHQIMQVWVAERRRGEGLARALYEHGDKMIGLYHAPDEHCTPEGLAFKHAVGGDTIDPDLAYAA